MKRTALLSVFLLVVVGVLNGCQPTTETPPAATTVTATPETVDKAAIEAELRRIENDWPRVVKERDAAAVTACRSR